MPWTVRDVFPYVAVLLLASAFVWAVSFPPLPPADFTFANNTEIKTVDPAIVTGQPEGRIIAAIFEGLLGSDPETMEPSTDWGASEKVEVSEDQKTYTLTIRPNARWSTPHGPGDPILAADFHWSFRRFLHPETAAEYGYQLYYVVNAEKYNTGRVEPGDLVEVELPPRPKRGQLFPRGPILHGKLIEKQTAADGKTAIYAVEIDGKTRKFSNVETPSPGVERSLQVLIDFDRAVGIRVLSERVLEIKLNNPTPFFPKLLGFYPLFPVNRKCVEEFGYPDFTKPQNLVSNGPYRLEFRRIRDRIRLVRNEDYWNRDNVKLKIVDALATKDMVTSLNLYLSGECDWIPSIPNTMISAIKEQRPEFHPEPFLGIYYYRVNVTKKPLDDVRVRQALNLALDRSQIVRGVTRAGEIPAFSFVPPGVPGYTSGTCPTPDLARARALLREAGYADPRELPELSLLYNSDEAHRQIAEVLQRQCLENLGIRVRLTNQEWASYLQTVQNLEYQLARAAWIGDYVDPNTFLDMFVTDGANNQTGWSNRDYDRLISEAGREPDRAKRMDLLRQAEQILMTELPVIPIYYYVTKNLVRPYVHGFRTNLQDHHPLQFLSVDQEQKQRVLSAEGWR